MADSRGFIRFVARTMQISIVVSLLSLVAITILNWRSGVEAAPWWFYLVVLVGLAAFWLLTKLFMHLSKRSG